VSGWLTRGTRSPVGGYIVVAAEAGEGREQRVPLASRPRAQWRDSAMRAGMPISRDLDQQGPRSAGTSISRDWSTAVMAMRRLFQIGAAALAPMRDTRKVQARGGKTIICSSNRPSECPDAEVRHSVDGQGTDFRIDKDTSKHLIPVWFMVPKSATAIASHYGGLRNHHTRPLSP
jgi:hypothetical protein